MSSSISTHELRTKEVLFSWMRSTLPMGNYEYAVVNYLAAGDLVWLKEKKRFRGVGRYVCRL
jgi:hypothetical protein